MSSFGLFLLTPCPDRWMTWADGRALERVYCNTCTHGDGSMHAVQPIFYKPDRS